MRCRRLLGGERVGVCGQFAHGAIGQAGERDDPATAVFGGWVDEDVDVLGLAHQTVRRQGMAADQCVFRACFFQITREALEVFPGRGSGELSHAPGRLRQ